MLGAILGDIAGSRFEFSNTTKAPQDLWTDDCYATDDSVLTAMVAKSLLESECVSELEDKLISNFRWAVDKYPNAGYGKRFVKWAGSLTDTSCDSWGNGACMRVSPVAYCARSITECTELAKRVTVITHNSDEGMMGGATTAELVYLALHGADKCELERYVCARFAYSPRLSDHQQFVFDVSCAGSLPAAVCAFVNARNFEQAIRNAIELGGDSDTIACITGAIAEAYRMEHSHYTTDIIDFTEFNSSEMAQRYLPDELLQPVLELRDRWIQGEPHLLKWDLY